MDSTRTLTMSVKELNRLEVRWAGVASTEIRTFSTDQVARASRPEVSCLGILFALREEVHA